ncbi:MAG: hypothetical protein RI900_3583, partial [Actinomycetota bacterium]
MGITYTPEAEAFRTEIRAWLRENLPAGWFDAVERGEAVELSPEERKAFNESWPTKLYEGG